MKSPYIINNRNVRFVFYVVKYFVKKESNIYVHDHTCKSKRLYRTQNK